MISAPTRDGPLAQSIVALAERSATRATHGAMTALLAGCDPQNPTCLDRRVSDLSTRAAVAFVDGVKQSLAFGGAGDRVPGRRGDGSGAGRALAPRAPDTRSRRLAQRQAPASPVAPAAVGARAPAST